MEDTRAIHNAGFILQPSLPRFSPGFLGDKLSILLFMPVLLDISDFDCWHLNHNVRVISAICSNNDIRFKIIYKLILNFVGGFVIFDMC